MGNPEDIMEDTGKKNKLIITNNNVFLNTDSVFIEYHDVIKSPYFTLLIYLADSKFDGIDDIMDLSEVKGLDLDALYEWYLNREHQFLLDNFQFREGITFSNPMDTDGNMWKMDFTYSMFENIPDIVFRDTALNFVTTLAVLIKKNIVKKYYIYTERYNKNIEDELRDAFPNVKYVYGGDLSKVLEKEDISNNTTFVLSDIKKILAIKRANKLDLSSIIIADKYQYNYNGKTEEPILPLDMIFKENIFKLDFFNNISQ